MVLPIVVFLLMIIQTIFSQLAMEIYAYSFIAEKHIEKSSIERVMELKYENTQHGKNRNKIKKQNNTDKNIKAQKISDKNTNHRVVETSLVFSFIKPVKGGVTSSYFGDVVDRVSTHRGHDWAVPTGTDVMASADGVVEKAYYSTSYGYNVLINHLNGIQTRYAHMSKLYVKSGQAVKQGQLLGLSGSTGDSTGPHIHFEVVRNGIRINPLSVLN